MVLNISKSTNYYIATIRESSEMSEFKTISTDSGYLIRVAKCADGSLKAQSLLFPKSQYNENTAIILSHALGSMWI